MLLLIAVILAVFVLVRLLSLSGPRYSGPKTDHFDGKRFINPTGIQAKGLSDVFKWMISRKRKKWTIKAGNMPGKRPLNHFHDGIRITFVNHSTFLIQVAGLNILTDPVWSQRASPYAWAGPKRMRLPGVKMEDLPKIDLILLSHNHYDHLDIPTMQVLNGAHHPQIITPLGVAALLTKNYISNAADIDWWESKQIKNGVTIHSVPAQHFSGRGIADRDGTLWCGYVLETPNGNMYYAGDTGYNEITFVEIGERFKPVKLSVIPIGAYQPEWFMSPIHVSPREAVQIHRDVRSAKSIGCHFGTFPLADEGADDPLEDLGKALIEKNIPRDEFITLTEGEALVID